MKRIASIDDLAVVYLASVSNEVLRYLVRQAAFSERVCESVAVGRILGRWGSDADLFEWCAAQSDEHVATEWLRLAIQLRLETILGDNSDLDSPDVDVITRERLRATALPLPERQDALRRLDAEARRRFTENAWTDRLSRYDRNLSTISSIASAIPGTLRSAHGVLGRQRSAHLASSAPVRARLDELREALANVAQDLSRTDALLDAEAEALKARDVLLAHLRAEPSTAPPAKQWSVERYVVLASVVVVGAYMTLAFVELLHIPPHYFIFFPGPLSIIGLAVMAIGGAVSVSWPLPPSPSLVRRQREWLTWHSAGESLASHFDELRSKVLAKLRELPDQGASLVQFEAELGKIVPGSVPAMPAWALLEPALTEPVEDISKKKHIIQRVIVACFAAILLSVALAILRIPDRMRPSTHAPRIAPAANPVPSQDIALATPSPLAQPGPPANTDPVRTTVARNAADASMPTPVPLAATDPAPPSPSVPPSGCRLELSNSFHLRRSATHSRSGSLLYPAGSVVDVIAATNLFRAGDQRLFRVVVQGDRAEGFVFLTPSERARCPAIDATPSTAVSAPEAQSLPDWGSGPKPEAATASSYFRHGREVHPAEHAFDGNVATAWNDGVDGDARGEWLEARFATAHRITGLRVATGFLHVTRTGLDLFYANARIHTLRVVADGRVLGEWSSANGDQRDILAAGFDVTARVIRIEVIDTFPGSRFQDVCISEVAFRGLNDESSIESR